MGHFQCLEGIKMRKNIYINTVLLFFLGMIPVYSSPNVTHLRKYELPLPASVAIPSYDPQIGFDKYQDKVFIRGPLDESTRKVLVRIYSNTDDQKKINDLYRSHNQEYWPELILFGTPVIAMMACPPLFGAGMLIGVCTKYNEPPITTKTYRSNNGVARSSIQTNDQYIYQPMTLINAAFFAINLDPWLCILGNISGLILFSQNSPIPAYEANSFPCSTFDKALYESSLMSEELWAEFKLAGYYNDNDQLNDKFFQDYKDKKLLIPEKFKPYEAGIYEAFDTYLKENAEKFSTPNINPAAQRQPLSAILPQSK